MKKLFSFLVLVTFLTVFAIGNNIYADSSVSILLDLSDEKIVQGSDIQITARIGEIAATDDGISELDMNIEFDTAAFESLSFAPLSHTDDNWEYTATDTGIRVKYTDPGSGIATEDNQIISSNQNLFRFSLKVKSGAEPGEYNITLSGSGQSVVGGAAGEDGERIQFSINPFSAGILIEQKPDLSDNAYLKSLSVSGYSFEPEFDKEILIYNINEVLNVRSLEVIAEAEDENASVEIRGNTDLKDGINQIDIIVTAEDMQTQKSYKIIFYNSLNSQPNTSGPSTTTTSSDNPSSSPSASTSGSQSRSQQSRTSSRATGTSSTPSSNNNNKNNSGKNINAPYSDDFSKVPLRETRYNKLIAMIVAAVSLPFAISGGFLIYNKVK